MYYFPFLELIDKFVKRWNSHTVPYRIWQVSFLTPSFIGGFIFDHNWRVSLGLLGVAILILCVFLYPVCWYEKRHKKEVK